MFLPSALRIFGGEHPQRDLPSPISLTVVLLGPPHPRSPTAHIIPRGSSHSPQHFQENRAGQGGTRSTHVPLTRRRGAWKKQ